MYMNLCPTQGHWPLIFGPSLLICGEHFQFPSLKITKHRYHLWLPEFSSFLGLIPPISGHESSCAPLSPCSGPPLHSFLLYPNWSLSPWPRPSAQSTPPRPEALLQTQMLVCRIHNPPPNCLGLYEEACEGTPCHG